MNPLPSIDPSALAELATAVWRLAARPGDGAAPRRVRAVADALTALGVDTAGYDGLPFDSGMRLRVLAFQPVEGLAEERVLETVRPSVRVHGAQIQLGEVIVGVPEPPDEPEPDAEPDAGPAVAPEPSGTASAVTGEPAPENPPTPVHPKGAAR